MALSGYPSLRRRALSAALVLALAPTAASAQVRVHIQAPPPVVLAPGDTLGGRAVVAAPGEPSCLVTQGGGLFGSSLFARAELQMIVPNTRIGEWRAAVTPAFGRCRQPQNPYRARLVVFDRLRASGNTAILQRGSLVCTLGAGNAGDQLVCNRPLRCNLAFARCTNP